MNYFYSFFKKNVHIEKEKIYEEEPLISLNDTIISIDDYYNTNVSVEDTNNVSIYDTNYTNNTSIYDTNYTNNTNNTNNTNMEDSNSNYTSNTNMEDSKKEELKNKKYCICILLKKIYRYMKCC
jgi:hypothetical protein